MERPFPLALHRGPPYRVVKVHRELPPAYLSSLYKKSSISRSALGRGSTIPVTTTSHSARGIHIHHAPVSFSTVRETGVGEGTGAGVGGGVTTRMGTGVASVGAGTDVASVGVGVKVGMAVGVGVAVGSGVGV